MKAVLRKIGLVVIGICILFLIFTGKDMLISLNEPVDIFVDYPESYDDVKAVRTEINMILDKFAEEETKTTSSSGAVTDVRYDYYYVLPVYTANDENPYFVGIKVSADDKKEYNKVSNATWDFLNGEIDELESLQFEGGFKKMEEEAYYYFVEWFEEAEWFENEEEQEKYVLPLLLEPIVLDNVKKSALVVGISLLVSIIIIIWSYIPSKKKEIPAPTKSVMTINNVSYPIGNFEKVNKLVVEGKKDKAVKELAAIVKFSQEEAEAVINAWDSYWN